MILETDSKYLSKDEVKDGDIVTIFDEGKMVDKEHQGKKTRKLQITLKLPNGKTKITDLNNTSVNNMIRSYGKDTAEWVGQSARVNLSKMLIAGKMQTVLILTHPSEDTEGNIIQS